MFAGLPSRGPLLKAASDAAETQPFDLQGVQVPDSLVPTSSPEVPTEKLRGTYQSSKPKAPVAMALPDETSISTDMMLIVDYVLVSLRGR